MVIANFAKFARIVIFTTRGGRLWSPHEGILFLANPVLHLTTRRARIVLCRFWAHQGHQHLCFE